MLFVFETPDAEEAFVSAAGRAHRVPLFTSDLELFEERGVSGDVWRPLPPSTGWCTIPSSWNSMCPAFVPMRPSSGARKRRCTGKNN